MIKGIISFILAHLLFFGGVNTKIYTAPPKVSSPTPIATTTSTQAEETVEKVTSKNSVATSTKNPAVNKTTTTKTPTTESKTVTQTKTVTIPTQPVQPSIDFVLINEFARKAIVNVLCSTKYGTLSPISGTGVVVGDDGLILTNAHIGQYFLLKDYIEKNYVECIARVGSPAYPKYKLDLVYISPNWVKENKALLKEQAPKGTGEDDFAFLRIISMIDGSNPPSKFSFIPMDIRENINRDEPVLLASYPAGFLGGLSILQGLNITTAITKIAEIYTFKDGSVDLVSVPGTVVSQKGSSGGAVVDQYAKVIGIISTSSDGDKTSERDLRAITVAYINRALQKEIGINLAQFVYSDHAEFAKVFASTSVPTLSKIIIDELDK